MSFRSRILNEKKMSETTSTVDSESTLGSITGITKSFLSESSQPSSDGSSALTSAVLTFAVSSATSESTEFFEINAGENKSVYRWGQYDGDLAAGGQGGGRRRTLSTLSVMTAEPIEYSYGANESEGMFLYIILNQKVYIIVSFSESSDSIVSIPTKSASATTAVLPQQQQASASESCATAIPPTPKRKRLVPGNPSTHGGIDLRFHQPSLAAAASEIHQIRLQKDPPSYYHVMELNPGPSKSLHSSVSPSITLYSLSRHGSSPLQCPVPVSSP